MIRKTLVKYKLSKSYTYCIHLHTLVSYNCVSERQDGPVSSGGYSASEIAFQDGKIKARTARLAYVCLIEFIASICFFISVLQAHRKNLFADVAFARGLENSWDFFCILDRLAIPRPCRFEFDAMLWVFLCRLICTHSAFFALRFVIACDSNQARAFVQGDLLH